MKFISLISSGIDSPVATYLMSDIADEIILLHGDIRPFTDDNEIKNFNKLTDHLKKICNSKIKINIIPHGNNLKIFLKNCNNRYTCVFCKRMLLRYAGEIAKKEDCDAIIMGDSLGQVASQTLQNLKSIDGAVSIPVLRPLIGYDKVDIIKIAKKIETYDLSIAPSKACSAVPNKPATSVKLEQISNEEEKINIEKSIKKAVQKIEQSYSL